MLKNIPERLYHKSSPANREYIQLYGLMPYVGDSYRLHYDEDATLKPYIFLYDKRYGDYDTTYDDDIYEIDTKHLNKHLLDKDPDEYMYNECGCYVYPIKIEPQSIKLIYIGTGESE